MAILIASQITFVKASSELANTAAGSRRLGASHSPFWNGVEFQVNGYDFVVLTDEKGQPRTNESGKVNPLPVLTTKVGNLFLSSLTKEQVDKDGNILVPQGTFVSAWTKHLSEAIAANKTDGEILTEFVESTKDKTVKVSVRKFPKRNSTGREYVGQIRDFDFVLLSLYVSHAERLISVHLI